MDIGDVDPSVAVAVALGLFEPSVAAQQLEPAVPVGAPPQLESAVAAPQLEPVQTNKGIFWN